MKRNNPWPNGAFCYKNVKKTQNILEKCKKILGTR